MFNINIEGDVRGNQIEIHQHNRRNLLDDLCSGLLTLQTRKYSHKDEDEKNDSITDWLRAKGYDVTDQTRQGRSGSNRLLFKSGELDLAVRDKDGLVISIVEAFELSSCGEKNTIITSHIEKLIKRYDTAGNKENFIIVYSKASDFIGLWNRYRKFVDGNFFHQELKLMEHNTSKSDLKVGVNTFHRNDVLQTLYHLFVNMNISK